ncbi:MAG TPA: chromosome segregation protein SMC [Myxococcales bacterium]|nr:chromosome segregation protein SMC [Myxococcales bacterium]
MPLELLERVKAMRAEAKALLARQSELYWRNWVYGDAVDVAATYRGHQALFSPDAIGAVGRLLGLTDDPRERRALTLFRLYLIGEAVGRAVAPLSDQALTLEAEATFVTPAGIEQPYRELNQLLANEVSYGLRGQISEAAVSVVRKLNPILERKEAVASQALAGLGYPRPEQFAEALREVDPKRLSKLANDVLDGTQALYERSMNTAIHAELGIGLAGMRRADVPRFDRNPALDAWFPAAKLLPTLRATFAGLGIDVAKQANLRIDDAPLPKKDPRAVCFPIAVPGDVRLSVKPLGGVSDYESLFHEAGHAEQYAHVRDEPFELQLLGDGTVGEAFAFLFEGLIQNPRWLAEKVGLGGDRAAAFVRGAAVRKLYLLRRYAGKLLFNLAWSRGAADPRDLYRRTLSRAYGFPLSDADADRWLVDHDDFLASADYFRAWFLAAQIEAWLEKRFGPAWWDEKAAGDALIGLWQPGNAVGPEDLARELGDAGIRPEPLLALLRAALGG